MINHKRMNYIVSRKGKGHWVLSCIPHGYIGASTKMATFDSRGAAVATASLLLSRGDTLTTPSTEATKRSYA